MTGRPRFFFGTIFFIFAVLIKLILLIIVSFARKLNLDIYLFFPFMLSQDLIMSIAIFLICDCGLFFIQKIPYKSIKGILNTIIYALYFCVIVFELLSIKFVSLLGTYFTYNILKYGDHISNFRGLLAREYDGLAVILTITLFIIFACTLRIYRRYKETPARPRKLKFYLIWSSSFLVYFIVSFCIHQFYFFKRNLYVIERNPVLELVTSFIYIQPMEDRTENSTTLPEKNKDAMANKPSTPLISFRADSLVNKGSMTEPAGINRLSGEQLKKFNIILYKFESTCGYYLGALNEEYKVFTPNLTRLAENGLLLAHHYAQEPASLKAMYSMLSGKYSYKSREWEEFIHKAEKDLFIPQFLDSDVYAKYFIGTASGLIYRQNEMLNNKFDKIIDKEVLKAENSPYKDYILSLDDRAMVDRFDQFLDENSQPFFMFFCPVFPHHPYNIPDDIPPILPGKDDTDRYKNSLHFSDLVVGQIEQLLIKHGILENTIFIIVADHAEALFQHPGNFIHSSYLYQENIYTFCIFSNPLLFPPQVYPHITRHVDIAPSLLDILNIKTEVAFDGVSVFSPQWQQYAPFFTGFSDSYLGLRDGEWKYIINCYYDSEELYNLVSDPWEKNNLTAMYPELSRLFKGEILKFEKYINRK